MKRQNYTITDVTGEEGQKKLDHYNKWLLSDRPQGSIYPGYTRVKKKVSPVTVDKKPKKSHNKRTETVIFKGNLTMTKVTNLSRAIDIVRANSDKAIAIASIMETLGVTKSNAFVYYTKATKALGTVKTDKVAEGVVDKAVKTARAKKANPVTETSPEKARAKVAEIDAVIASLKASGTKVASPFAGL